MSTEIERSEDRSPEWHRAKDRMDLARALSRSKAVPQRYWGKPDDIFATVLHGEELGLSPSVSLVNIYMIEGTPTFAARFILGLMLRHGLIQFRERTDERVTVYGRRPNGTHLEVTWSMADARRAGLDGKQNWTKYPRQMLTARAVTELGRTLFADDLILGEAYTPEEVGHVGVYDAIDVDDGYVPAGIDTVTGEILDDDDDAVDVTAADIVDAVVAHNAYLRQRAERDADDQAEAEADQLDLLEDGD
jgi:hypothetical protein